MKNASIVIPVFNSAKTLPLTLGALENQSFRDFDVLVVDDGSSDSTLGALEKFRKKSKLRVSVLKQSHKGAAAARNLGAKKASSGLVVFLDSDCVPEKNFLEKVLKAMQDRELSGVACAYKTRNSDSLIARYVGYEIERRQEKMIGKDIDSAATYAAAYRKRVFSEAGFFDESFPTASGEDFDFSYRLKRKGFKLRLLPNAVVGHVHPDSLTAYLKQQFKRAYWHSFALRKKGNMLKGDSYLGNEAQVQGILAGLFLVSIPVSLALFSVIPLIAAGGLLFLSNLSFGFWAFKKEKKFLVLAPLIASLRSVVWVLGALKFFVSK